MAHPRSELDKELLSPLRLSILAALSRVGEAEFAAIRDAIETNDAELSRQLTRLSDVGYVRIDKQRSGRYMKTWLSLTKEGHAALTAHIAALKRITDN
ncbi:transcriptional regulator [Arthrobacter sp. zg-Y1219]|jgi:DNA-binding MarR family transcriptional regulator|uniref:transcriptional regulator n=1 Tax=unclassified Arthrobacter TaxID=235627 RepID=UPI0024C2F6B2|nr:MULTISPECIES: transcriptional regulator [unclassified Arthrobacter]MDK1329090.1 transcriptional regulator [Arthrobacter sp. zg-Y1143]MDK1358705.1 transcriptional regulator [Arthrobacter sp. zg-Y1219]